MKLKIHKMHGAGNDFLIIDGLKEKIAPLPKEAILSLCHRQFGIGADGLMILHPGTKTEVRWDFWNSDGSVAEMCGNGARCAIAYLKKHHFPQTPEIGLETLAGVVKGKVLSTGEVEILFPLKKNLEIKDSAIEYEEGILTLSLINTGVPHAVIEVKSLRTYPIEKVGQFVQAHPLFQPAGTNVTYFQKGEHQEVLSTTFERGVEQETFACGTGAMAAALVFAERYSSSFPIRVKVPGGDLRIDHREVQYYLTGPAVSVYETEIVGWQKDHLPTLYSK